MRACGLKGVSEEDEGRRAFAQSLNANQRKLTAATSNSGCCRTDCQQLDGPLAGECPIETVGKSRFRRDTVFAASGFGTDITPWPIYDFCHRSHRKFSAASYNVLLEHKANLPVFLL